MLSLDPLILPLFITTQAGLKANILLLDTLTKDNQESSLIPLLSWIQAIVSSSNQWIKDNTTISISLNMQDPKVLKDYKLEESTHQDCKSDSKETIHKEKAT